MNFSNRPLNSSRHSMTIDLLFISSSFRWCFPCLPRIKYDLRIKTEGRKCWRAGLMSQKSSYLFISRLGQRQLLLVPATTSWIFLFFAAIGLRPSEFLYTWLMTILYRASSRRLEELPLPMTLARIAVDGV